LGLDKNFYQRPDMKCRTRLTKRVALKHKSEKVTVREQLLLKLLSPHLVQAYRNAEMLTHMQQKLSLIDRALNGLNLGIIVLAANGKVRLATASAAQQVTNYLGHCSSRENRLPEALWNWVRQQNIASSGGMLQRHSPFVLEREGKRLGIRLVADFDQTLLLLEDQPTTIQPQGPAPCGLSSREAQVLDWVAQGKTNKETGAILELSARTVQKHLEHIYQKMGVESRTAAAARAYEIASKATKQTSMFLFVVINSLIT
jgi:DNA-binding CsgD family transcriptional regulator